jgi:hypothetical protein
MNYVKIFTGKVKAEGSTLEYLLESDSYTHYRVINDNDNPSLYKLMDKDILLSEVGLNYFTHKLYELKEVEPSCWKGCAEGLLKTNDNGYIFLNGDSVGQITSYGIFDWFGEVFKSRTIAPFRQYFMVRFDESKLDKSIAISLLLRRFAWFQQ